MTVFSGSRLASFNINISRLWNTDAVSRTVSNNTLDDITQGKSHVILKIPNNIHLDENQKEHVLDALFRRNFEVQHIIVMPSGTIAMEYLLRRTRMD
jgi:hypothetical protein